ncbi:MAG TPA: hypothetical protein DIT25_02545 [Candidatus Moranbacteria bacterium]|nr:hypothetical protein [Candidatus Moranbacteria bacterium]
MRIKINLIPPYRKEEIRKASRLRSVIRWELELIFMLAVFAVFLAGINHILRFSLSAVNSNFSIAIKDNTQYKIIEKHDNEINEINNAVADVAKIQKDQMYWADFLHSFSLAVPDGIKVSDLSSKNYSIYLSGEADTRENLLRLKDKLTEDSCFSEVNLPLSNLVSKNDAIFQLNFKIKKECLKRDAGEIKK